MRKILLVLGFTALTGSAFSQATFGVHANGIMASVKDKNLLSEDDDDVNWKNKSRFGWKIGGVMNLPLSETFSFMPQLNVLSKGGKVEVSESYSDPDFGQVTLDAKTEATYTYLELPLNFTYNTETFFIGAGPSISYGLGGKYKYKYSISDGSDSFTEDDSEDIKFDNDEDADHISLKPLEFGANFIAGYKLSNGLFINAQFNLGLNNISPYEDTELKNRYFGVGIGYFFGGVGSAKK